MTAHDFRQAEAIFADLIARDTAERARLLDQRCKDNPGLRADVESLLAHHDAADEETGFLGDAQKIADELGLVGRALPEDAVLPPGSRVADYTIERVIGSGGMGVVYVARQERPKRTVALKVIRRGLATSSMVRRFEHEAEMLGRLQHPGIAQIFLAGSTDGPDGARPFIAMELVAGPPLTQYAEQHRLGTRERLDLMAKVCDAVQHAHQRGVIHRDLKPANILVTDAGGGIQPKVLDFGVARASDADFHVTTLQTSVGQLIGTLPYMSPEQVIADPREVDTRSDVYALGVVLYQLLTGRLPLDLSSRSIPEAARIIRDEPPARLSSISKVFRGDIEKIVGKAIEKDKARRYQSAAELRDDILRHLAGRPILARDDSALYVLRQQLRRYRGVAAAAAVFVIGLSAFSIYAHRQSAENRKARDAAEVAQGKTAAALAVAERERSRADGKARELDERLVESDIARGRAEALLGGVAAGEDLIWPRLLRDPSLTRARWALWEIYSRNPCLWTVRSLHGRPEALALSPDGGLAGVAHVDGSVVVYRTADGAISATIPVGERLGTLAFTADGGALVTGSNKGAADVWDVASASRTASYAGGAAHQGAVRAIAFSADGRRLATGGADRLTRVWDAAQPTAPPLWSVTDELITSLAFSPDGATLACATVQPGLRLRDAATGALLRTLEGDDSWPVAAAFSGDGRVLATVSWDRTTRLWNPATGECTAVIPIRLIAIRGIGLNRDGSLLLTGASDEVQLWDLPPGPGTDPRPVAPSDPRHIRTLLGHRDGLTAVALDPAGERAVSISYDGTVKAWEAGGNPGCSILDGHTGWVFGVAFDPGVKRLASGAGDGTIRIWDSPWPGPSRATRTTQGRNWTRGLEFRHDGALLASGSGDGVIRLIDPATGLAIGEMSASKSEVLSVSWSPDGATLASAGADRVVRFWDASSRKEIGSVSGFGGLARGVAFSPDGSTVAAAADDGLHLLDPSTVQRLERVPGTGSCWGVAISRDGRWLATGGADGVTRIWDLSQRTPAGLGNPRMLQGHKRMIAGVAFSPDSTLLVSGSDDATVRVWDVRTGVNLATIEPGQGEVSHVAWSPDGRHIAAACQGNAVVLADLDHFRTHISGNLAYRLERHRADLPEGATAEQVREAVLNAR